MARTIAFTVQLFQLSSQRWGFFLLCAFLGSCLGLGASAQTVVGGQTFTDGLAIVDSPQLGSTLQVGSTMPLAIDITGNGKLSIDSSAPDSAADTRLTFLEVYLVSSQAATNITVVKGSDYLTGEAGSSVKHMDYTIPSCAAPGSYDLTIYEGSVINGTEFFSITPIPVTVTTSRPGGQPCSTLFNNIRNLPQDSSPPPNQPWLGSSQSGSGSSASSSTTTTGSEENSSAASSTNSGAVATVTKTVDGKTATLTVSAKPVTLTQVISSVQTKTMTLTQSGTTEILTTTVDTVSTSTVVVSSTTSAPPGFFPANSALRLPPRSLAVTLGFVPALLFLLAM